MAPAPSPIELHRAEKRLRAELERYGLLLAHDVLLPSATRCVAGQSISGSWWGHPAGSLIYAALQQVESDIARVKLVAQKSTLVHRRLWPALVAAARPGQKWQSMGLAADALELLRYIEAMGGVRADTLELSPFRRPAELTKELERRLLIFSTQEHTPEGHHVKTLVPFATWQLHLNIPDSELPDPESAMAALTAPVREWVGERVAGLLPWLAAEAPATGRRRRAK